MIEHEQTAKATIAALQSDFLDRCEAEYEQFMFNTQDHPAVRGRLAEWFGAIPLGILRKEIEHLANANSAMIANAQAQVSEALPNLKFENGRLSTDSRAASAVKAIAEQSKRFTSLELLYQQHMASDNIPEALKVTRELVEELARAYQALLSIRAQSTTQESIGSQYLKLREEVRAFRKFLADRYEMQLERAVSFNTPLFDFAASLLAGEQVHLSVPTNASAGSQAASPVSKEER